MQVAVEHRQIARVHEHLLVPDAKSMSTISVYPQVGIEASMPGRARARAAECESREHRQGPVRRRGVGDGEPDADLVIGLERDPRSCGAERRRVASLIVVAGR